MDLMLCIYVICHDFDLTRTAHSVDNLITYLECLQCLQVTTLIVFQGKRKKILESHDGNQVLCPTKSLHQIKSLKSSPHLLRYSTRSVKGFMLASYVAVIFSGCGRNGK